MKDEVIPSSCRSLMTGRLMFLIVMALAAITVAGCASGYTRVREIMAAPDGFVGKEVRLQGTVGKAIDPPRPQAYMLRDASGEIMVVTRGELPAPDSEVALRGIVKSTVVRGTRWTLDLRVEETQRLR
jgi:uncharacterized protein YdeI (BOF family)